MVTAGNGPDRGKRVRQRNLRLADDLVAEIDRLRGLVPRERFMRAVIVGFVEFYGSRDGFDGAAYVTEMEDSEATRQRRALIARMEAHGASWSGFLRDMLAYGESVFSDGGGHVIEQLADAVIVTDAKLIVRTWNAGAERLFGWSPQEAIGQHLRTLLSDDFAPADVQANLVAVQAGETIRRTGAWRGAGRPPREVRAEEVTVGLFKDGHFCGIAVVLRELADA